MAALQLIAGLCDSLVLQNPDLNSPIFCAPFRSFVVGDGPGFTMAKGLNQPPQIQIMHAHQVLNYALRASFTQAAISRRVAGCIRKSHYFNQPTVRVSLGLLSLCPGCRFIDGLLGGCVDSAAVYFEEDRDCANRFVIIESVDTVVGQRRSLKSRICLVLCSVGSGSGIISESRILRNLSSHPPSILLRFSGGLFSGSNPHLIVLGEFSCLLESLGGSQVLLIKLDRIGYQVTFRISSSFCLQTQTAHDVGHWVFLFAPQTSAVRANLCVSRHEHRSLVAARVSDFERIAVADTHDALNLLLLTLRDLYGTDTTRALREGTDCGHQRYRNGQSHWHRD